MMHYERPIICSIAGFDPSGGAGVLADIKTFEQFRCVGMAAISALTVQTEDCFIDVQWLSFERIKKQLEPLFKNYAIDTVKIGIVKDAKTFLELTAQLKNWNPDLRIVWDPVLASSSGFKLFDGVEERSLPFLLEHIYLITPNVPELKRLTGIQELQAAASILAAFTNVLVKGGHNDQHPGTDFLFTTSGSSIALPAATSDCYPKHGSGCVLSSAIAASLANGADPETACRQAKSYIEQILVSNKNLLAYHVA